MSNDTSRIVRESYGEIAQSSQAEDRARDHARSVSNGYSEEELACIPEDADLGLGCGNPAGISDAMPGETVLDLGSGGGIDCFLVSGMVGPEGRVIGVDTTPEMVTRARKAADEGGYGNVEFLKGEITDLPVADGSVDLVISNCVISLVPDQTRVFSEAFRVLRPGGRMIISDTITTVSGLEGTGATRANLAFPGEPGIGKQGYFAQVEATGFQHIEVLKESSYPADMAFEEALAKRLTAELGVPADALDKSRASMISITFRATRPSA